MRNSGGAPGGLRGRTIAVTAAAAASGIVLGIGASEGLAGGSGTATPAVAPPPGQLPPLPGSHSAPHAPHGSLPPLAGTHTHRHPASPAPSAGRPRAHHRPTSSGSNSVPVSVAPVERVAVRRSTRRHALPISAPARAVTHTGHFTG